MPRVFQYRYIDLLRHGEAAGGACFRGSRDDPLSASGWAQLAAATADADAAGRAPWGRIICSPAQRCLAFAQHLGDQLGLSVEPLDAFRERDFGAWEGLRADQIAEADLARFWSDPPRFDPPDAEPFAAFRTRVARGWRALLDDPGRHDLLVTHGGVIRIILGEVLGLADERLILIEVPPACRSRLRVPIGGGHASLVAHGEPSAEPC